MARSAESTNMTSSRKLPITITMATLLAFVSLVGSGAIASAQDEGQPAAPTGPFPEIESCQALFTAIDSVAADSEKLGTTLPEGGVEDRDTLLAGIFEGTRLMMDLGDRMFTAYDEHEEKCKAALREAERTEELGKIYKRVAEPAASGFEFLVRVKASAEAIGDTQTVEEMTLAIKGYRTAMFKLVDFCEEDLPEAAAKARCGELRKQLDERLPE